MIFNKKIFHRNFAVRLFIIINNTFIDKFINYSTTGTSIIDIKLVELKKLMNSKIKISIIMMLLCGHSNVKSQDIHFSQYYMVPLQQNPAFAGTQYDLGVNINYKDQWRSVTSPYKTFAASCDMKLNKKKAIKRFLAGGINFFSDKAGDANMGITQGSFSFAYHVLFKGNNKLSVGFTGGFGQRSIDYGKLQWGNQYNGVLYNASLPSREPQVSDNFTYVDLGTGVLWSYKKSEKYMRGNDQRRVNIGTALLHINQPDNSFYDTGNERLNSKLVLHGDGLFGINNTNFSIVPGFMLCKQGATQEFYAGSMLKYILLETSRYTNYLKGAAISMGAYYRYGDAIAVTCLFEFSNYNIGISYDINASGLSAVSNGLGGVEIALRFTQPSPFVYKSQTRD